VGFTIFSSQDREWDAPSGGDPSRGIVRLSDDLTEMRANVWRLPPGSRGRRHAERVQEEMFVVLEGTATLALGDPAEMTELSRGSIAVVEPGTAIQVLNGSDEEAVILIVGAPPVAGEAAYLPDG
jgi:quercetin dioxygenase-like cupin family protein